MAMRTPAGTGKWDVLIFTPSHAQGHRRRMHAPPAHEKARRARSGRAVFCGGATQKRNPSASPPYGVCLFIAHVVEFAMQVPPRTFVARAEDKQASK